jgi:hypothetical protein
VGALRRALVCASIAICASYSTAVAGDSASAITADDARAIKSSIDSNWNISPEVAEAGPQILEFRIHLKPDGAVDDVRLLAPQPLPASCRSAAEIAQRAVWKASPLRGTKGISTLVVKFDPSKMREDAVTSSAPLP